LKIVERVENDLRKLLFQANHFVMDVSLHVDRKSTVAIFDRLGNDLLDFDLFGFHHCTNGERETRNHRSENEESLHFGTFLSE
jgi:hypothetical protein